MMKRIITIFLLFSMCLSFCACGEARAASSNSKGAFPLRNDIHFGESKEQVKEKEKESNTLELTAEWDRGMYYRGKGTIAGYDGDVDYYFSDNQLTELLYTLHFYTDDSSQKVDQLDQAFTTIYESCKRQYGEETHSNKDRIVSKFSGRAIYEFTDNKGNMMDYREWVLEGIYDENVTIDLIEYKYDFSSILGSFPVYAIQLSYHYYSDEEIANALIEETSNAMEADSVF